MDDFCGPGPISTRLLEVSNLIQLHISKEREGEVNFEKLLVLLDEARHMFNGMTNRYHELDGIERYNCYQVAEIIRELKLRASHNLGCIFDEIRFDPKTGMILKPRITQSG
jgi:hypothetical protein